MKPPPLQVKEDSYYITHVSEHSVEPIPNLRESGGHR